MRIPIANRRAILPACLAALLTAFSLVGHGLHLLPGMGHVPGCQACCHSRCSGGHDHACHHEPHGAGIDAPELSAASDCGTCPICNFFATVKVVIATAAPAWTAQAVIVAVAPAHVDAPARPIRPLGPRGPPQV